MAPSAKCLRYKHNNLSSIPKTRVNSWAQRSGPMTLLVGGLKEEAPWASLASQYHGTSELHIRWETMSQNLRRRKNTRCWLLTSTLKSVLTYTGTWAHTHPHIPMFTCTYTHIRIHKHTDTPTILTRKRRIIFSLSPVSTPCDFVLVQGCVSFSS